MRTFSFDHEFKERSAKTVFRAISTWLEREEARIKESVEFNKILAVHGKGWIFVWDRNAKKTIDFRMEETPQGTKVLVEITPSRGYFDDVPTCEAEIIESWSALMNEVWATVEGGQMAREVLKPIEEQKDTAKATKEASKKIILIGLGVALVGSLIIYGIVELFGAQNELVSNILGLMIGSIIAFGILFAVIGVVTYASGRSDLKRLVRRETGRK
jgi:hypothetical protein